MSGWDGRGGSRKWRAVRVIVFARDGRVCAIQGPTCTQHATTVDHVIPLALGGALLDPDNCRPACASCNGRAGATLRWNRDRLGALSRDYYA